MKHVCKREVRQNSSKLFNEDSEPAIVTNHGQPEYFVGNIGTVQNLNEAISSLNSFRDSLYDTSSMNVSGTQPIGAVTSAMEAEIKTSSPTPFVEKGGAIKYAKHSHK